MGKLLFTWEETFPKASQLLLSLDQQLLLFAPHAWGSHDSRTYLRQEREDLNRGMERREALIAEAMGLSPSEADSPKD